VSGNGRELGGSFALGLWRVHRAGYGAMQHKVVIARFDSSTGQLTIDERFREEGATEPGFRMDNKTWPHGGDAKGKPHGAVFSR